MLQSGYRISDSLIDGASFQIFQLEHRYLEKDLSALLERCAPDNVPEPSLVRAVAAVSISLQIDCRETP